MTKPRDKVGAAYVSEKGSHRQLSDIVYADKMAKALRDTPRPPPPNVPTHFNGKLIKDLTSAERQEFYISMQPASTQAVLRRDPKDDAEAWGKPIPLTWKAVPEADMSTTKGREMGVGMRSLSPGDVAAYGSFKNRQKNTLGDSKDSSVTDEKKEKAVWAYTYSKPAKPSLEELARLTAHTELEGAIVQPDILKDEEKPAQSGLFIRGFNWVSDRIGAALYAIESWGREDRD